MFCSHGLCDLHELAVFLHLYYGGIVHGLGKLVGVRDKIQKYSFIY